MLPCCVAPFAFVKLRQQQLTDYWSAIVQIVEMDIFFHLGCLGLKRMPNNSKTTWQCEACRKEPKPKVKFVKLTTSASSTDHESSVTPMATASTVSSDSSSDSEDEISITMETTGTVNKFSALATLDYSDYDIINDSSGWLTCDIVQQYKCYYKK